MNRKTYNKFQNKIFCILEYAIWINPNDLLAVLEYVRIKRLGTKRVPKDVIFDTSMWYYDVPSFLAHFSAILHS